MKCGYRMANRLFQHLVFEGLFVGIYDAFQTIQCSVIESSEQQNKPSPNTASISSSGMPLVSGYTFNGTMSIQAVKRRVWSTHRSKLSIALSAPSHFSSKAAEYYSPTMKLQIQKLPCMGYNLHSISSCKYGVTSPTSQLNAQFVAVESETPFARNSRGMIFIGKKCSVTPLKANLRAIWNVPREDTTMG